MKKQSLTLLLAVLLTGFGCKDSDEETRQSVNFDRGALLTHYADHLIIPAYENYRTATGELLQAVNGFETQRDLPHLLACRLAWRTALMAWQRVSLYDFGPAKDFFLQAGTNIFPTNTMEINHNIGSGVYDLDASSNADAKGFPAIDFLLHGTGNTDVDILAAFTTDSDAANRLQYLTDLATRIDSDARKVYAGWVATEGNYRALFVANTGTDVGSSLGVMLNAFNKSFETSRASKLGIPSGALTFSQTPLPTHVEAYYESSHNVAYLAESLDAHADLYLGRGVAGSMCNSLNEYLKFIGTQHHGGPLYAAIENQIADARMAVNGMNDPLADYVQTHGEEVLATYVELQQLVVFWKLDMMSALGILIAYQDNDGD